LVTYVAMLDVPRPVVEYLARLPALHDNDGPADAEPDTMRFRLYHLPARLADQARRS
jgi:hypothetical protein